MNKSTTKISRENFTWLFEQPLDIKVNVLQQHLSICQLVINQILEEEVKHLSGQRYSHQKPNEGRYSRYGFNPGSVNIGGKKLKVDVPKVIDKQHGVFQSLESYRELKDLDGFDEQTMQAVLHGLSNRDYQGVIDYLEEGFGLSKSSVSSKFIRASEDRLKEFETRDISEHKLLAIFIDGKYLAKQQMIVVMGITEEGAKVMLGLLQTTTENSTAIGQLFRQLKERAMQYEEGLLFITDGAKGIKKAIEEEFGEKAIIQRCIWHKRENVLSYLSEDVKDEIKKEYHQALAEADYKDAKQKLLLLKSKLEKINRQAANSLAEGMEELLTLHKLELAEDFSISFSTTNCIESVNAQIKKYTGRVTHWSNSNQRYRWVAAALLEIEIKMRKVDNFKKMKYMKKAIVKHLANQTSPS
jgi:transposase-like protein